MPLCSSRDRDHVRDHAPETTANVSSPRPRSLDPDNHAMQLRLVALALALATAEGFTPGLARPQPSLARATSAATRVSLVASADAAPAGATKKELLAEAVRGPRCHSARQPRFLAAACVL